MVSASISINALGAPVSPSKRCAILHDLVVAASAQINAQINDFTARSVAALLAAAQTSSDANEANACFAAGNLLKNNAYPFYHLASIALRKAFQDGVDRLDTLVQQAMASGAGELALVPFAEIENRLLIERAARPLELANATLLSRVGLQIATLGERENFTAVDNPFRPAALVAALDGAWREFTPDASLHGLMLKMMQGGVVPDMAPVLHAVERTCIDAGILPGLAEHRSIRKSSSNRPSAGAACANPALMHQLREMFGSPRHPGAAGSNDSDADRLQPQRQAAAPAPAISLALSTYLSHLQARTRKQPWAGETEANNRPGPMGGAGVAEASQDRSDGVPHGPDHPTAAASGPCSAVSDASGATGADATSTGALNRAAASLPFPLRELQQHMSRGTMTRADETTVDVMTRIFETVFQDPNIPAEMKELIGYLQLPLLKAALLDKEFFFENAHPARQLISLLTRSSVGWDRTRGRADPLYQAIERNVDRIQQFDVELALFADVVADLEAFLAQEEARAGVQLAEPITQALQQEKIHEATRAAASDVAARIADGEVAPFVETFLEDRWVPVLAMAYGVRDEKPQVLASALRTMDDLVWSVRPKFTAQQRRELVEKLPALLTTLNKWLNVLKWDDADRLQFFADLAECHASIVRAPLELSPQRQLELAVEAARLAAQRRLQKRTAVEPAADAHVAQVAALERGMWFEFTQPASGVQRVKLAWVSPLRSLYIFTTVRREEAFSLSAEILAQQFRQQQVRIVDTDGFVDRALADLLGQPLVPTPDDARCDAANAI